MIDKIVSDTQTAVCDVESGSTVMVSGFGDAGVPVALLEMLTRRNLRDLTIISNNAGTGSEGLAALLASGAVRRLICSYPRSRGSFVFEDLVRAKKLEYELCPQGTLSERIRAGGAGIAAFYTPTAAGTELGRNREHRTFAEGECVLEFALRADFALIRGARADRWGNVVYRKSGRNFGPTMAMAAATTIVEVPEVVALGSLDPESIITPGIFVQRIVET
jgi:3-oxoadipate CoA-transferase alpha subunit